MLTLTLTLSLTLNLTLTLSERNALLWRPVNYNLAREFLHTFPDFVSNVYRRQRTWPEIYGGYFAC